MPYDPNPVTERERSNAYFTVWFGLAASLAAAAAALLPLPDQMGQFGALVAGLWILVCVFNRRFDSYFRELRDFGAVVALAIIGLWLAASGFDWLPRPLADPRLLTALAAVGFHVGFLFAQSRGGR